MCGAGERMGGGTMKLEIELVGVMKRNGKVCYILSYQ